MILSWVLRDYAKPMMMKIPWIVRGYAESALDGDTWYGQQAVYRVSFGNFTFFLALCMVLMGVKDRSDSRDIIHHGSWHLKFLAWIILMIFPFFLPPVLIDAYAWMARFGSGAFLVVQMIILLDFAAAWNQSWASKESEKWLYALLAVTVGLYLGSAVAIGFMFHWFHPDPSCSLNALLLSMTLVLCLCFSMVSVHPSVPSGSLMPSAVITAYCTYLCFSALSSEPASYTCNGISRDASTLSASTLSAGMLLTMLSVVYSALRAGSNSSFFNTSDVENSSQDPDAGARLGPYQQLVTAGGDLPEEPDLEPEDQEMKRAAAPLGPVQYNYSFFHLIFALASMYVAMLMTGWGEESEEQDKIDVGWISVWVKIISQWATALLYSWTLLAPILLPDRDFGF